MRNHFTVSKSYLRFVAYSPTRGVYLGAGKWSSDIADSQGDLVMALTTPELLRGVLSGLPDVPADWNPVGVPLRHMGFQIRVQAALEAAKQEEGTS